MQSDYIHCKKEMVILTSLGLISQLQQNDTMHVTSTLSLYISYTLENECKCGICIQFSELFIATGTCHVVSKQPLMGDRSLLYVTLSGLMDSHLLHHSIPHISWGIFYMFCMLFIARCQENMKHGTEIILLIG